MLIIVTNEFKNNTHSSLNTVISIHESFVNVSEGEIILLKFECKQKVLGLSVVLKLRLLSQLSFVLKLYSQRVT